MTFFLTCLYFLWVLTVKIYRTSGKNICRLNSSASSSREKFSVVEGTCSPELSIFVVVIVNLILICSIFTFFMDLSKLPSYYLLHLCSYLIQVVVNVYCREKIPFSSMSNSLRSKQNKNVSGMDRQTAVTKQSVFSKSKLGLALIVRCTFLL